MAPLRLGFLVGKDNDPVVRGSQPLSMPKKFCFTSDMSWGGKYHIDSQVAWTIGQRYKDEIKVDLIHPDEITLDRLQKNDVNFVIGYDYLNALLADKDKRENSAVAKRVHKALSSPKGKCFPSWEMQDWVYRKNLYMRQCEKAKIPMLPTIFIPSPKVDTVKLLKDIKKRGWKKFVIKPEMSCWSIGFLAATVEDCEKDPNLLKNHFSKDPMPAYLCQEFLEDPEFPGQSFSEIRCWWINGEFSHAAWTTGESEDKGIDGISVPPPKAFLEQAVEVGRRAMREVCKVCKFNGETHAPVVIRTDIGVCGFPVKGTNWDPKKTGFFLNEIENMGTNWLTRYFANDAPGLKGQSFKNFEGFSIRDRLVEAVVKKARALCKVTPEGSEPLTWTRGGSFGGISTGPGFLAGLSDVRGVDVASGSGKKRKAMTAVASAPKRVKA